MSINKNNYEAFFLDYIEGNLSAEEVAELILFMEKNPLLKEELDGFDLLEVNPIANVSFNKEALKVHINKNNVDDFIIGSIEGVNTELDEKELATFVNENPESQLLLNRYKKTVLSAPTVTFPKKNSLKKRSKVVVLYPLLAVAASIILFFMLSNGTEQQEYNPQAIIATQTSSDLEDKNDFIANEVQIIPEKIEEEKNIVTPIQNNLVPENYIAPRNNDELAIEPKDSIQAIPNKEEILPTPENLIVTNDSVAIPEVDSTIIFNEPSNNDLTFNEWKNNQIRNKVLNQNSDDVSKIKNDEVLNAIAGGLNKVSKQEIAYNNEAHENYTTKGFSIGSFEFSRTKRKKF